jgi:hypothetical protein
MNLPITQGDVARAQGGGVNGVYQLSFNNNGLVLYPVIPSTDFKTLNVQVNRGMVSQGSINGTNSFNLTRK